MIILHSVTTTIGDWTIRVDPPHGADPKNREHVHISKRGIRGEYSWNVDGTRHDKSNFPSSDKCIKRAKKIASETLGIPVNALDFLTAVDGRSTIVIRTRASGQNTYARSERYYVRKDENIYLLLCEKGVVLVADSSDNWRGAESGEEFISE